MDDFLLFKSRLHQRIMVGTIAQPCQFRIRTFYTEANIFAMYFAIAGAAVSPGLSIPSK
jgi:hypothetical protein